MTFNGICLITKKRKRLRVEARSRLKRGQWEEQWDSQLVTCHSHHSRSLPWHDRRALRMLAVGDQVKIADVETAARLASRLSS